MRQKNFKRKEAEISTELSRLRSDTEKKVNELEKERGEFVREMSRRVFPIEVESLSVRDDGEGMSVCLSVCLSVSLSLSPPSLLYIRVLALAYNNNNSFLCTLVCDSSYTCNSIPVHVLVCVPEYTHRTLKCSTMDVVLPLHSDKSPCTLDYAAAGEIDCDASLDVDEGWVLSGIHHYSSPSMRIVSATLPSNGDHTAYLKRGKLTSQLLDKCSRATFSMSL